MWHWGHSTNAGGFKARWLNLCLARDLLFFRFGSAPMINSVLLLFSYILPDLLKFRQLRPAVVDFVFRAAAFTFVKVLAAGWAQAGAVLFAECLHRDI